MYKLPPAIQTSESLESAELVLLLRKDTVDVSLKILVVDWWSNQCEEKDGKEDRRRSAFTRGAICMETGRGRRSVVSEKVVLGVEEGVSGMVRDSVSDDFSRSRFVNARNPDLKKSGYPRKGFRSCMV